MESRYLRTADALVLASRHAVQCCRSLLPELPEHVLAPPGADHAGPAPGPEIIANRSRDSGPLRLLFVGSLTPRKGLLPALRSLARVPEIPWEIHVAGDTRRDPRYVKKARQCVRKWGLSDRVHFRGRVSDSRLQRLYRECHALYMPYAYEGYGIVFLEAMAAGLPVLARDRKRLLAMGLAAREAFLRHPTWEQSMGCVEQFLAGLCRSNRSA